MNIAITGSTGFIGSALMTRLATNSSIKLFPFDKNKYSFSLTHSLKDFVKNKDIIIHLTGETNTNLPEKCYEVNTLGTFHLLEALSLYGKSHTQFIFSSSFALYEESAKKEKLHEENTKTVPRNHYGMSKFFAEEFINFYNRKHNMQTRILRISNPYGPGYKKNTPGIISILIDKIQNGEVIKIDGDGTQLRDFIFIDDVVQAFVNVLNYQKPSLIINICSGKETQLLTIIKKVEEILKKKAILQFNKRYPEKGYWVGDSRKASREINFNSRTDIDKGLQKTVNWYLNTKRI